MKIKSVIVILIACCFFLLQAGNAYCTENTPGFRDIKGSFAEQSIIRLTKQGFIHGVNPGQFAPKDHITRLQFTILVAKALGVQPFFPAEPRFSDISPGTLDQGYVEALASVGLIKGTGEKTFAGNSSLRRLDAVLITRRLLEEEAAGIPKSKPKYADSGQNSPYLSRAEAALLIDRVLESRIGQAHRNTQLPAGPLKLGIGETKVIGFSVPQLPVAFTPVMGTDNPAICSVSPNDGLISGKQQGTGTLTVNVGSSSFPETMEITKSIVGLGFNRGDTGTVAGKTYSTVYYKVYEQLPDAGFKNLENTKYPGPAGGLLSQSADWTGFYRQHGRDIIVDLSTLNTVSGISLEFMQNAGWGITLPKYMGAEVSADGVSWYRLGRVYHGIAPTDKSVHNMELSLVFPPVTAKYLKISFPVDVFVLARHLTVKLGAPAEKPVVLAPVVEEDSKGNYLQDPSIKDILLVFTGDRSNQQNFSANDFLPLAAYLDRQGKIKGRMFDTMLFLPYNRLPCTKVGWDAYLNDLFTPGKQLHALEDTVATINNSGGVQKKEKVILTIPYPDSSQPYFDRTLSFSDKYITKEQAAQNRFAAVKSYYGELLNKWDQAGFKNLDLAGMYWYNESINTTVYQETYLVQQVAQMVRGHNQKFFWIPYYGAQGYSEWKSYGFTHVLIQPNYYATPPTSEDRMKQSADMAGEYGTGIEIEFDNRVLYDPYYHNLFYKEINKAHQLGLDGNIVNAYYTGIKGTLLDAVHSNVPEVRRIYDDLYRWISGSFK